MCKKKSDTLASAPRPRLRSTTPSAAATTTPGSGGSNRKPSSSSSGCSVISLSSIQESLPDQLILYSFPEILDATNNFLLKRYSSSSSCSSWRCKLRDKDVLVFQREFRGGDAAKVQDRLSSISRSHHKSLVRLVGASLHADGHSIFLLYEFVPGANLVDCLRNPRNPRYCALPSWTSRMMVVTDVAQGLEYIHRHSCTSRSRDHAVHNRIKSSSIIVLERPKIHAKICHFGTVELTGEMDDEHEEEEQRQRHTGCGIERVESRKVKKPSRRRKVEGTRGYMAPEVIAGGGPTQKTDVYAFGVVMLEILSGEEPIRYKYDGRRLESVLLIDTAGDVMGTSEGEWDEEERRRRLRRWVDRRLKDSFPVEVAEKVLALALQCVEAEAVNRPDMEMVAGKMSRFLMKSSEWESKNRMLTDLSVSMAPR